MPRAPQILRDLDAILAELTQMGHCAGMTELGRSLVPDERSRQVLRHAEAEFEHSAEIVHRADMPAVGGLQVVFHRLEALA